MPLEVTPGHRPVSERGRFIRETAPGLHLPYNSRFLGKPGPVRRAAVFLDRDGVIVRDVHYLKTASQIELLPQVESLRALLDRFYVVVTTNQSGIARNFFTEQDLLSIHSDLVSRLAALGVVIDAFYYCPHLPTAVLETYRIDCGCRKPKPGMLLRAGTDWGISLEKSYMVGDSQRDMEAGQAAGVAGNIMLAKDPDRSPKYVYAEDLAHAAAIVVGGAP